MPLRCEVLAEAGAVAERGADIIAAAARDAVNTRGRFLLAISGGRTPWIMLRALAGRDLPWRETHIFQVDERIAPAGHADRNLTHLTASLHTDAPGLPVTVHAMPVEAANPEEAAAQYAVLLREHAGSPPVLDLVHLGLGPDGHTASLVPGDSALDVQDRDVAVTGLYQGRRRMTLTYPMLNRAREVLWLVTGADKVKALQQLRAGDRAIPASGVHQERALVLADAASVRPT